jgi:P protein
MPINPRIKLIFKGSFLTDHYDNLANDFMYFYLSLDHHDGNSQNISQLFKFPIKEAAKIDTAKEIKRSKSIYLNETDFENLQQNLSTLKVNLFTKLDTSFPVIFCYDPSPLDKDLGLILAAVVLVGLYILIIWELVHRTFAAIIASTLAIGEFL